MSKITCDILMSFQVLFLTKTSTFAFNNLIIAKKCTYYATYYKYINMHQNHMIIYGTNK